jgi:hypothetical protein
MLDQQCSNHNEAKLMSHNFCKLRVPQLNYRAFEGTIVLKSYGDSVIDKFDAKTLFERLCMEADSRDMLVCGAEALCFKKSISVKGSHCKFSDAVILVSISKSK